MLSAAQVKYIRSLSQQKYRKAHNAYLVEGYKIAKEYLSARVPLQYIVATDDFIEENKALLSHYDDTNIISVKDFELEKISSLKTPHDVLLAAPVNKKEVTLADGQWALMLDTVQDPGNVGTILRIADWYGIEHVICSETCADAYSPKVVQSSMGALLRVNVMEADLQQFLQKSKVPVYAAVLNGNNIKTLEDKKPGIILLGNESRGISGSLQQYAAKHVTIPKKGRAESLNVAVAAGIICNELII